MTQLRYAENFLAVKNELGEGSLWSADEQRLYWLDINKKLVYRANVTDKAYEVFNVGVEVGVMAFRANGGIVMATRNGFAFWEPNITGPRFFVNPIADPTKTRFNDGNVDAKGRFWAGTTQPDPSIFVCKLYRLDPDTTVHTMDTGLGMPNGMGWSPDNKLMYLTDSLAKTIYAYDFDLATGAIANRRPFIQTTNEPGVPDGLTIDSEGFLWSMRYNGGKVTRYDPQGKIEREVHVPTLHTTSCAFGGKGLNELYITTAWQELSDEQKKQQPTAGDLFLITTDVKGTLRNKFAG